MLLSWLKSLLFQFIRLHETRITSRAFDWAPGLPPLRKRSNISQPLRRRKVIFQKCQKVGDILLKLSVRVIFGWTSTWNCGSNNWTKNSSSVFRCKWDATLRSLSLPVWILRSFSVFSLKSIKKLHWGWYWSQNKVDIIWGMFKKYMMWALHIQTWVSLWSLSQVWRSIHATCGIFPRLLPTFCLIHMLVGAIFGFEKQNGLDKKWPDQDVVPWLARVLTVKLKQLVICVCQRAYFSTILQWLQCPLPHTFCALSNATLSSIESMVRWWIHVYLYLARHPHQRDCFMRMCLG